MRKRRPPRVAWVMLDPTGDECNQITFSKKAALAWLEEEVSPTERVRWTVAKYVLAPVKPEGG